jgi:DMSO/TMAO reductase YedYZ molybdopterin-dependent catalytic subunit
MDSSQIKPVTILVVALLIAGAAMAALIFLQPTDSSSEYYVEVVGSNGVSQNVTLAEMMLMDSVSGNSSYENTYGNVRGVGVYKGVKISDLVNLVGGMDEGYVVRIVAEDGYSQTFERFKVYPNLTIWNLQGDMILAYEYDGHTVPEYEDGARLAFIPEDGYYSSADANATSEQDTSAAGPQWVSNVARIEVLENLYNSTYSVSETLLRTLPSITGEGGYKKKDGGPIIGPYNFTGVAFSILLQEFSTVPNDYVLIARSSDGYTIEYTKAVVEGELSGYTPSGDPLDSINSTMILAYEQDGSPISDGGPLKIAFLNDDGNLTDGFRWAKDVVSITILELSSTTSLLWDFSASHLEQWIVNDSFISIKDDHETIVRSE